MGRSETRLERIEQAVKPVVSIVWCTYAGEPDENVPGEPECTVNVPGQAPERMPLRQAMELYPDAELTHVIIEYAEVEPEEP